MAVTQPSTTISTLAKNYLEELFRVLEVHSINRLTIDWPRFRNDVLAQAGAAQTIPDTYPAIREALRLLGDGHSSYRSATGTVIFVPNRTCRASGAGVPTVPPTIGYVTIGSIGFMSDPMFSDSPATYTTRTNEPHA